MEMIAGGGDISLAGEAAHWLVESSENVVIGKLGNICLACISGTAADEWC
jgi:hypothetical protein